MNCHHFKTKFYVLSSVKGQTFEDSENLVGLLDAIFHSDFNGTLQNPWEAQNFENSLNRMFEDWYVPMKDENLAVNALMYAYQYKTEIGGKLYTSYPVTWEISEVLDFCHSRDQSWVKSSRISNPKNKDL